MTLARSILIFFGALVFAALLWAYVRLSAAYDADVDLPIKLTAPKGYALASGLPERLHVRVRGAGWQILLMNFTKHANFQFDLAERAMPADGMLPLHSDEITNAADLPSDVHITNVDPDSLELQFGKALPKVLAIAPRVDVKPARGYMIVGDPIVTPRSIAVLGAASVLDSLSAIPTKTVEVGDARETVEQIVPLSDSLDNVLTIANAQDITVRVTVEAIGEQKIAGIPVTVEALPPEFDLVLIPSRVAVTVRGGVDELAKLTSQGIHASVRYDPMVLDTAKSIVPSIAVPNGMLFLSVDPPNLKFIVRKKEHISAAKKLKEETGHGAP